MSTLTAQIQLRRDTQANWIISNPVLGAGEMAISSDQLHIGTDQPKFKIGDGVQTWMNLDYYPVGSGSTPTLAQVLAQAALTGGNDITMTNGDDIKSADSNVILNFGSGTYASLTTDGTNFLTAYLYLDRVNDQGILGDQNFNYLFGDGSSPTTLNYILGSSNQTKLTHANKIVLDSPIVELAQETPSRFVTTDVNGFLDTVKVIPSGVVVGDTDSQTLTNKTIDGDNNTVQNLVYTALKTVLANANKGIYYNNSGVPALFDLTSFARTILDDADSNAAKRTLNISRIIGKNYSAVSVSNTTSEEVIRTIQIAAGDLNSGEMFEVFNQLGFNNNGNTKTVRWYINTTPDLTGSPVLIATSPTNASIQSAPLHRYFICASDTTIKSPVPASTTYLTNWLVANAALTTIVVPSLSAGFYLVITGQKVTSGTDTLTLDSVWINKNV